MYLYIFIYTPIFIYIYIQIHLCLYLAMHLRTHFVVREASHGCQFTHIYTPASFILRRFRPIERADKKWTRKCSVDSFAPLAGDSVTWLLMLK